MERAGVVSILALILLYFELISAFSRKLPFGTDEEIYFSRPNTNGQKRALEPEIQKITGFFSSMKNEIAKLNEKVDKINEKLMERKACKAVDTIYESCHQALLENSHAQNGVYRVKTKTPQTFTNVYCRMTSLPGCSGGGWTMVMKINGSKETFSYSSPYWNNKKDYSRRDGETGLDYMETKLATFWSTSFTQLCVGMRVNSSLRFIPISYKANSLYDVLTDGRFRPTSIARESWKSLYDNDFSLQHNCERQGFNVAAEESGHTRVRIGILGNNEYNCYSADSFIGYGAIEASKRRYCYMTGIVNSCGNSAHCSADDGDKEIRAMGYIFVR